MDEDEEVKIHAGASVCGEADIRGDVTIHPETVVHPKAVIVADVCSPTTHAGHARSDVLGWRRWRRWLSASRRSPSAAATCPAALFSPGILLS